NGFDQYGHFARTRLKLSTCLEYIASPAGYSGCVARFNGFNAASPEEEGEAEASTSATEMIQLLLDRIEGENEELTGGTGAGAGPAIGVGQAGSTEAGDKAAEGRA